MTRFSLLTLPVLALLAACSGGGGGDSMTNATPVTCAKYCSMFAANCTGSNYTYTDDADCQTQCGTWAQGTPGVENENTLECRYSHAQAAADDSHCQEAQASSTSCI